jgi:hypothetical protein
LDLSVLVVLPPALPGHLSGPYVYSGYIDI